MIATLLRPDASLVLLCAAALAPAGDSSGPDAAPAPVRYGRDIRPILSDKCFVCHGPDTGSREADLRLDERDFALADRGGYAAIVPGDADASELFRRVSSDGPGSADAAAGESPRQAERRRARARAALDR